MTKTIGLSTLAIASLLPACSQTRPHSESSKSGGQANAVYSDQGPSTRELCDLLGIQAVRFNIDLKENRRLQFYKDIWIDGKLVESSQMGALTMGEDRDSVSMIWRIEPEVFRLRMTRNDGSFVSFELSELKDLPAMGAVGLVRAGELTLKRGQKSPFLGLSFGREIVEMVNLSDPAGTGPRSERAVVFYVEPMPELVAAR